MELAIDSVGNAASVAVSDRGRPLAEVTWPSGRRHTTSLIPTIDAVVRLAGIDRAELRAVFVDVGPGAYSGIRAGLATAKALALALDLQAVGLGRLEIEAYAHAAAARPLAALHDAGRGDWALACYQGPAEAWRELAGPALHPLPALDTALAAVPEAGLLCGDVEALDDALRARLRGAGWTVAAPAASMRRAALLAELGWRRLQAGGDFDPARLEPVYLREPPIGPQPPRGQRGSGKEPA